MLITLSRRTAICQSVAEVKLTGVAPLGAVSYIFNFNLIEGLTYTCENFKEIGVSVNYLLNSKYRLLESLLNGTNYQVFFLL